MHRCGWDSSDWAIWRSDGGPLLGAGLPTTLWARRAESLRQFEPGRFHAAASLPELGHRSDVVGICVFSDADVRQVVLGPDGVLAGLSAGSVLVIHSTVSVATCRELAAQAVKAGVEVVDAPVTGARARALAGDLVVLLAAAPPRSRRRGRCCRPSREPPRTSVPSAAGSG